MSEERTICIVNGPMTSNEAIADLLVSMPVWALTTPERQELHSLGRELTLDTYKVSSNENCLSGMWRMVLDHYPYTQKVLLLEFDQAALSILSRWNFTLLEDGYHGVPPEWLPDWAK